MKFNLKKALCVTAAAFVATAALNMNVILAAGPMITVTAAGKQIVSSSDLQKVKKKIAHLNQEDCTVTITGVKGAEVVAVLKQLVPEATTMKDPAVVTLNNGGGSIKYDALPAIKPIPRSQNLIKNIKNAKGEDDYNALDSSYRTKLMDHTGKLVSEGESVVVGPRNEGLYQKVDHIKQEADAKQIALKVEVKNGKFAVPFSVTVNDKIVIEKTRKMNKVMQALIDFDIENRGAAMHTAVAAPTALLNPSALAPVVEEAPVTETKKEEVKQPSGEVSKYELIEKTVIVKKDGKTKKTKTKQLVQEAKKSNSK